MMMRSNLHVTVVVLAGTFLLVAGAMAAPATIDTNFLLLVRSGTIERWGVSGTGTGTQWNKTNDVVQIASSDLGGYAASIRCLAFSPDGKKLAALNYDGSGHSRVLLYSYNYATHTATGAGTNSGALLATDVGESWALAWSPNDTNLYVSTGGGASGYGSVVLRVDPATGAKSRVETHIKLTIQLVGFGGSRSQTPSSAAMVSNGTGSIAKPQSSRSTSSR